MAEQAVLVYIASLDEETGLDDIEDPLVEVIEGAGVGEFDGNLIGPDGVVLYMYGPDADQLWATVAPVLRSAALGPGAYAIKRYGDPGAREERVELS